MKVSYFREMREHHMVIASGECQCPEYQMKMVQRNPIKGLHVPVIRHMNGEVLYDYSITGCHSLQTLTELAPISKQLLVALIEELNQVLEELEQYLVDGNYLALRPEFIYLEKWNRENVRVKYCFFPFQAAAPEEQMRELLKYVLNEVDYQEKPAVNLAYELFQQASQEDFLIKQLSNVIKAAMPEPEERAEGCMQGTVQTEVAVRACRTYDLMREEIHGNNEEKEDVGSTQRKRFLNGRTNRRGREIVLSEILK